MVDLIKRSLRLEAVEVGVTTRGLLEHQRGLLVRQVGLHRHRGLERLERAALGLGHDGIFGAVRPGADRARAGAGQAEAFVDVARGP